jgi:hypothetical protein
MAWRIGPLICSAPSSSCCLKLICVLPLAVCLAAGQSAEPANVPDCRPCSFSPGGKFPNYTFTFDLKVQGDDRVVDAIEVTRDSKPIQRLLVTGMQPMGRDEQFFFGGTDINFDGLLDLMLITRRGVANAYAEYWLFDPQRGIFANLGTFPLFRVDAEHHRLNTYERGGSGGLIHQSKEYAWEAGKLVVMREEKQESTSQPGVFRKVVRERINGVLKIVKTEISQKP